jgi:hypothetical protein
MHFQATGRNVNCARFVHTKNCLDGCLRETKIARKRVYNVPEIKFAVAQSTLQYSKHLCIDLSNVRACFANGVECSRQF